MKKILYLDMDNVLVDFPAGIAQVAPETRRAYEDRLDEVPGIFWCYSGSDHRNVLSHLITRVP